MTWVLAICPIIFNVLVLSFGLSMVGLSTSEILDSSL